MKDPIKQNKDRIKELNQLGQDTNHHAFSWRHSPFKGFRLIEGREALGDMRV
jgi:hypothetical protein